MKVSGERDLVGRYRADLPDGAVEFLELFPKGECVQEIRLKDGTAYNVRGRWDFSVDSDYLTLRGTRLALSPYGKLNPDIATIPSGTTGSLPVSRAITGRVSIMLHEGIDYRKQ